MIIINVVDIMAVSHASKSSNAKDTSIANQVYGSRPRPHPRSKHSPVRNGVRSQLHRICRHSVPDAPSATSSKLRTSMNVFSL